VGFAGDTEGSSRLTLPSFLIVIYGCTHQGRPTTSYYQLIAMVYELGILSIKGLVEEGGVSSLEMNVIARKIMKICDAPRPLPPLPVKMPSQLRGILPTVPFHILRDALTSCCMSEFAPCCPQRGPLLSGIFGSSLPPACHWNSWPCTSTCTSDSHISFYHTT